MMKTKKIAVGILAAVSMATCIAGMSVSANQVVGNYATFSWTTTTATTYNDTNSSRIVTANVTVYEDGTGRYITSNSKRNTGGNGTSASASVSSSTYPSSRYNFLLTGSIYNSNVDQSGVLESFRKSAN